MSFAQIKPGDLQVGYPVPYPLYDAEKRLLLARGSLLESERQLAQLMERGLFRKLKLASAGEPARAETSEEPGVDICQFDETRLAIGDVMQLQSQAEGDRVRYAVKLIGYLKGRSVIVTTPSVNGQVLLMREGQGFVVRMFSGKSAYAFTTTTLKVANTPFPHLHLVYPKEVRGLMVRKGARVTVDLIAAVVGKDGQSRAASLCDLSIGGAMLLSRAELGGKDEPVTVKFRVDVSGVEQYLSIPALIRNVKPEVGAEGGVPRFQHGVQFMVAPDNVQIALSAFVFQTLLDQSADT